MRKSKSGSRLNDTCTVRNIQKAVISVPFFG